MPLPENIHPYVSTTLPYDNIDRLEETLSGGGTSYRVNGIAIQQGFFGPHLPPSANLSTVKPKYPKRSVNPFALVLPDYNPGERTGPPLRQYVEVNTEEVMRNAWQKNLLWIIARLHVSIHQKTSGWTGFNISTRKEVTVLKDSIGYLPTINAPATNLPTVYEILSQSEKIRDSLSLKSIVLVCDQALYAKVTEIFWKKKEQFS